MVRNLENSTHGRIVNDPAKQERDYLAQLAGLRERQWPANVPTEARYPLGQKPLTEYLRHWASVVPDKPAIEFYGMTLTYAQLDEQSDRFANVLRGLGISPGDRVAVFMPNCPQFNITYWGIMKTGAVHVPVSPLSKDLELRHELGDARPKVVVCFDALLPLTRPVCEDLGIENIFITSYSELKPENPTMPLPEFFDLPKTEAADGVIDFYAALNGASPKALDYVPDLDDIAALNYTGGTTGLPKGCVHTHRNILHTLGSYSTVVFGEKAGVSDEIHLCFLPQFWIAGENTAVLLPIFEGATTVLLSRWDAVAFMTAVQHYRASLTFMLVDSIDDVLNQSALGNYDLGSLKTTCCVSFIKKINKDYRERWRALTGATIFEAAYGMTETHTCDTFTRGFQEDDLDLGFDPTFVGLPVPGCEIKICEFGSNELKPNGEEGEINIRTPSLLKGYWEKPDLNAKLFSDGWFKTGDLGMFTEDGFLRYLGRRKEMLKVSGMSVFPTELEAIMGRNPAIAACGVVGREDERKGQVPVAFVVLKPGSVETEESLRAWCKQSMSIYKVPEIRLMEALPMTATGKIIKVELEKNL